MRDPHPALPAVATGTAARSQGSPGLPGCSPVPGDAVRFLGKHPAPGNQRDSRGHCLTAKMQPYSPGCSLIPGMEPGSRGHSLAPRMQSWHQGMQLLSKRRSPAPANTPGVRGMQHCSRERPPARS